MWMYSYIDSDLKEQKAITQEIALASTKTNLSKQKTVISPKSQQPKTIEAKDSYSPNHKQEYLVQNCRSKAQWLQSLPARTPTAAKLSNYK